MVQFRYPSPGNRKPVQIPTADENDNNPYFVAHYVRDTTHQGTDPFFFHPELESARNALLPPDHPMVEELKAKLAGGPFSSPGNKGIFATDKTDYDPTGLRATMSTNWATANESLDKFEPNHLLKPIWAGRQEDILA